MRFPLFFRAPCSSSCAENEAKLSALRTVQDRVLRLEEEISILLAERERLKEDMADLTFEKHKLEEEVSTYKQRCAVYQEQNQSYHRFLVSIIKLIEEALP